MLIPVFTIGYGNRAIEVFLDILKTHEIGVLIDVRSKPYSKYNPAYRSKELEQHLASCNIIYEYMGDHLGGRPDDEAFMINGRVSHDLVRKSPGYMNAIREVVLKTGGSKRICVMCSELDPDHCHRKRLLAGDLIQAGATVLHIDAAGRLTDHSPLPVQQKLF